MDKETLVKSGQRLTELLDASKLRPLVAIWVYLEEVDAWRLWIVPPLKTSKEEFFLQVSKIISENRDQFEGLDISSIEFKKLTDPLVEIIGQMFRVEGTSDVYLENSTFNGFLVAKSILLRVELPKP